MTRPRSSSLEALTLDQSAAGLPSIKELAARRGIKFGMAIKASQLTNPALTSLIARESVILVAENDMKANVIQPSEGVFDYTKADAIAAFAVANGCALRGHPLIWHGSLPAWMLTAIENDWEATMDAHIAAVMARYPNVTNWDVCLEVLGPIGISATYPSGYRENSPWYIAAGGPSYITRAYELARQYCPQGTELAYCDFSTERNLTIHQSKRTAVIDLLDTLADAELVDAFAAQCHLFVSSDPTVFSEKAFRAFLTTVRGMGLKVHLSELDVAAQVSLTDENLDYQCAEMVKRVVGVWLEDVQAGEELLVWGVRDDLSWRSTYMSLNQRPLPWSAAGKPKAMERALRQLLACPP